MRTRGRLELIGVKKGRGGGGRDTSPKFRPICHPSERLRKYLKSSPAPPGHVLHLIVPSSLVTVTLLNASNIVFFNEKRGQRRTDGKREEEEERKWEADIVLQTSSAIYNWEGLSFADSIVQMSRPTWFIRGGISCHVGAHGSRGNNSRKTARISSATMSLDRRSTEILVWLRPTRNV